MKSKLFKKEDYSKILKLKTAEMVKYLQESEYGEEVNALATEVSGTDLVEQAITKNLARNYAKLKRISTPELNILIQAYLQRVDVYNIKTILRGKFAHADAPTINKLLRPLGTYPPTYYQKLMSAEGVAGAIKLLDLDEKVKTAALKKFQENNLLSQIENMLDQHYFYQVEALCERIPEEGKLFKEFLMYEQDVMNVKILLRLAVAKVPAHEIAETLCAYGPLIKKGLMKKLVKLSKFNIEHILIELEKTEVGKLIKKHHKEIVEQSILAPFETDVDTWLLRKSTLLLHQHPLSIDIILGYLFAKELEARNLQVLAKGKQLGLEEQFLEEQLIVA